MADDRPLPCPSTSAIIDIVYYNRQVTALTRQIEIPRNPGHANLNLCLDFVRQSTSRKGGDARLSIAERYRNRDDYVNRIRIAAQDLIQRGFLLPGDAAVIVQAAAAIPAFAAPAANPTPR